MLGAQSTHECVATPVPRVALVTIVLHKVELLRLDILELVYWAPVTI